MASTFNQPFISLIYKDFAEVFFKEQTFILLSHRNNDYVIKLILKKTLPFEPIYSILINEL